MTQKPAELASATIHLTFTDGRTVQLDLDTTEPGQPIGFQLDVENDQRVLPPEDFNYRRYALGTRRTIDLHLRGRGPISLPVSTKEAAS
jgi:hypothetical protein